MENTTEPNGDSLDILVNALERAVGMLGTRFENNKIKDNIMFARIRNKLYSIFNEKTK